MEEVLHLPCRSISSDLVEENPRTKKPTRSTPRNWQTGVPGDPGLRDRFSAATAKARLHGSRLRRHACGCGAQGSSDSKATTKNIKEQHEHKNQKNHNKVGVFGVFILSSMRQASLRCPRPGVDPAGGARAR